MEIENISEKREIEMADQLSLPPNRGRKQPARDALVAGLSREGKG